MVGSNDYGWSQYAEREKRKLDVEEVISAYGNRVVTWHLRQSGKEIWWESSDTGDVDYAWVAEYAKNTNCRGVSRSN